MAKLFFVAAAAIAVSSLAVSAETQGQDQGQNPGQGGTKPLCVPLNFNDKAADFATLNGLINVAVSSGMLKKLVPEPIVVTNQAVSPVPFSVLTTDFELRPIIKTLTVKGVQTVAPKQLKVLSENSVNVAADFNGTVAVDGTIRVEIHQLNRKWYDMCWTNIFKPTSCPPAIVDIDVDLGVVKPAFSADAQLKLQACASDVSPSVCSDVTVNDIITAALTKQFDPLLKRLLKRFSSASVLKIGIAFDSISNLGVHFSTSGPLISAIGRQLLKFTVQEVNKKGDAYKTLISVLQIVFKSILNNLIKEKLAPGFGNTCYDA